MFNVNFIFHEVFISSNRYFNSCVISEDNLHVVTAGICVAFDSKIVLGFFSIVFYYEVL